jgi:hypothetical protein
MATANNPFDLSVNTPQNLLGAATGVAAAPTATGYNAATAGATGYDAASRQSTGYDAAKAGLTNWDVQNNQTVQGQMTGLLSANSPLLQQARAASLAQMNQRGLVNSSMALGEGQKAVLAAAMPIAQQDASTFANSGQFNATAANQNAQFNVGQENQALGFTAQSANQAGSENLAARNQALGFSASAANQAALSNAQSANQAAQFTAGAENQASQQYASTINATVSKMLDQSMQYALANADSTTRIELQQLDATTRQALAATEAQYKTQMQASQSASDIFAQASKNIADTMANPDLPAYATTDGEPPKDDGSNLPPGAKMLDGKIVDANNQVLPSPKQAAVDMQKAYLQNSLEILSATSKIPGLKDLLIFS